MQLWYLDRGCELTSGVGPVKVDIETDELISMLTGFDAAKLAKLGRMNRILDEDNYQAALLEKLTEEAPEARQA
jgi:hypothetical protein